MKLIHNIEEMQNISAKYRFSNKRIGFVPTMGALHEGHLALLGAAKQRSDITVMSIFVNPTQFAPDEDLDKYPRPFEDDCYKAEKQGCDILFAPNANEMYPENSSTSVVVSDITAKLEGKSRPAHFNGVTTVVTKLLNIVMPHIAVFGQKDAQQAIVLQKMVNDLNMYVDIIVIPTIREKDGLALSSRNKYLTQDERQQAPSIYKGLHQALKSYGNGENLAKNLLSIIKEQYLKMSLFKYEYIAIVDTGTLNPIEIITGKTLIAVASRSQLSKTRLIDNVVIGGTL